MVKRASAHTESFLQLLVHELQDLYNCKQQIIHYVPKLIKAAAHQNLKQVLKAHLVESKQQLTRLKKVFQILREPVPSRQCLAMTGILKESDQILRETSKPLLRDAAIIAVAQKIEHYEMVSYGTARAHAKLLKYDLAADLLKESFDEAVAADKALTKIAKGSFFTTGINEEALEEVLVKN